MEGPAELSVPELPEAAQSNNTLCWQHNHNARYLARNNCTMHTTSGCPIENPAALWQERMICSIAATCHNWCSTQCPYHLFTGPCSTKVARMPIKAAAVLHPAPQAPRPTRPASGQACCHSHQTWRAAAARWPLPLRGTCLCCLLLSSSVLPYFLPVVQAE